MNSPLFTLLSAGVDVQALIRSNAPTPDRLMQTFSMIADGSDRAPAGSMLPPMMAVDVPTSGTVLASGARVTGHGWAIADGQIAEVSVSAGERLLCHATHGLYRPDIREGFPQYPKADHGGFSFSAVLDLPATDHVDLVFTMRTIDGRQHHCSVAVRIVEASAVAAAPEARSARRSSMQLHVDKAVADEQGRLKVLGWVIALGRLEQIGCGLLYKSPSTRDS